MIYFVTGKIGGGKTLLMLTKILEHLAAGGCVHTNIALNERAVDEWMMRKRKRRLVDGQINWHDFEREPQFHRSIYWGVPELPVWVVVDEAQLYYNQAESAMLLKQYMDLISFLTQSRKACVDVWFVTQHDTTVWAQFRHQALFGYRCRDMRQVNLPFVGRLPGLGLSWVKYDVMSGEIMERGKTPLSKDLFGLYDTRQMYDSQMNALQAAAKIWRPVDKKTPGKYEIDRDNTCGGWLARRFGLAGRYLVREEAVGGGAGQDRGGSAEGEGAGVRGVEELRGSGSGDW